MSHRDKKLRQIFQNYLRGNLFISRLFGQCPLKNKLLNRWIALRAERYNPVEKALKQIFCFGQSSCFKITVVMRFKWYRKQFFCALTFNFIGFVLIVDIDDVLFKKTYSDSGLTLNIDFYAHIFKLK